jgi:hypothetical protein
LQDLILTRLYLIEEYEHNLTQGAAGKANPELQVSLT